jgi:group I intron endonuclease
MDTMTYLNCIYDNHLENNRDCLATIEMPVTYTFYKIYCKDNSISDCYIGSSKNFARRHNAHKSDCNNPNHPNHNYKVYKFIREHGGFDNFKFEILAVEEFCDKDAAKHREKGFIFEHNAKLNCIVPGYSDRNNFKKKYDKLRLQCKIQCGCGAMTSEKNKMQHEGSQRHQQWVLENQQDENTTEKSPDNV